MKAHILVTATLAVATLVFLSARGCGRYGPPTTSGQPQGDPTPTARNPISGLPIEITVQQRSTTDIPGSDEELRITIDDITRSQVLVSLADAEGNVVTAQQSMKQDDTTNVRFRDFGYSLKLTTLTNNLLGDDFATFELSEVERAQQPPDRELTEAVKIERLILAVEELEAGVFIRNGREYTGNEAAEHLRYKLGRAGDRITTAEQFIEHMATKSSLTGGAYRIRMADGSDMSSAEFLKQKLTALEATQP